MSQTAPQPGDELQRVFATPRCPICGSVSSKYTGPSRTGLYEYRRCDGCGAGLKARLVWIERLTANGSVWDRV